VSIPQRECEWNRQREKKRKIFGANRKKREIKAEREEEISEIRDSSER